MAARLLCYRVPLRTLSKDKFALVTKSECMVGEKRFFSTKLRPPVQNVFPCTAFRQRKLEVKSEGITQATCSISRFTSTAFKISRNKGETDCKGSSSGEEQREVEKITIRLPWAERIPKLAFLLTNVFTPKECERYINISEQIGSESRTFPACGNRYVWDCKDAALEVFERIQTFLPKSWWPGTKLSGINSQLNFERYQTAESSEAKRDGTYTQSNGDRSYLTFHVFLNDLQDDGFTSLVSPPICQPASDSSNQTDALPLQRIKIQPRAGCVLVFQNDVFYESSELLEGTKYVLRGDVMYATTANNAGNVMDPIADPFRENQEPSTDAANVLQQMTWGHPKTARTVHVQATKPSPKGIPFYVPEMRGFIYVQ